MKLKTFKILISGRVQGVGFRPFIYNLAIKKSITGTVSNNENGVIITVSTTKEKVDAFLNNILNKKPNVSIILSHSITEIEARSFNKFSIQKSTTNKKITIPLTPDFSICKNCKNEMLDNTNRRYKYPFTTCVHCGPRYSITTEFPFDRVNTTINEFEMCDDCQNEYNNPIDRRFHSQTNSCKKCGVIIELIDNKNNVITALDLISKTTQIINDGKIIAIKNNNGYLLCCDASNSNAINELRKRKKRPNKPFAVIYPSINTIKEDFVVSKFELEELESPIAPIVILKNKKPRVKVNDIAHNLNQTGIMLPSSALLFLLLNDLKKPIIATSGNIHGAPIEYENKKAFKSLSNVADFFLNHNLKITFPQDDSVVKFENESRIIIRRSKGFAPNYLEYQSLTSNSILALGAHLKSSITFVGNSQAYVSQYLGNLDNYDVLIRYQNTINQYKKVLQTEPKTIIIDKHPQYQSSILGKEICMDKQINLVKVQHHKAHFCSVLGEHDLFDSKEKILGIIWDGNGFGDDNQIWGGEFFVYQKKEINRINHFEYFDSIANDKMAREPRLALLSLLNKNTRLLIKSKFTSTEWNIYNKALEKSRLKTSSVGRLFDAVASALNLIDINTYEAEASMLVENCALESENNNCIDFLEHSNYTTIPSGLIIEAILQSFNNGENKSFISSSFIYTLAKIILNQAMKFNIKTIACSGGVFQNSPLLKELKKLCKNHQIELKINRNLSANDENISLGQLIYHQNIKE